ncbi:hypothetical protein IWW37_005667 [Coemansia sp. RSA 2050]|nr:hypothetical protein IWW37_005667 [Coemansia sp. RSA 2050]KAJ2729329.1 hypothetical protein IW152_005668 [Coemansia sp. BCRC 34962]
MSNVVNPKQLLTDSSKLRILCVMFRHFSLEYNNIATLANSTSEPFKQLLENTIAHQPNLQSAAAALASTLESFVSNQNSRIFCALSDLYEWRRSGMRYNILQLTLRHIHSIFKRPPYEHRPYTQVYTYAQLVVMIYHACNPEAWSLLVEAYTALYERQFQREWVDKAKFTYVVGSPLAISSDTYKIIHECTLASYALQPLAPLPSVDMASNVPMQCDGNPAALGIKSGRVAKRRAHSTASKTKSAQMAIRAAIAKPRSVSFACPTSQAFAPPTAIATEHSVVSADSVSDFWLGAANLCAPSMEAANMPGLYQFGTNNVEPPPNHSLSGHVLEDTTALVAMGQQLLLPQQYQYPLDSLADLNREDFLSALGIGSLASAVYHISLASSPVSMAQTSGSAVTISGSFDAQIATSKASATSSYNTSSEPSFFHGDQG